ncbi:MAG: hypothetical protein Q3990_05795 [Desulfovibrionaceae bacterium]|nr:hypothetical protein [Desulfovibrionaceae bacterium]
MSWDSFFLSLDRFCGHVRDLCGASPVSMCRLHSADEEGMLLADNGALVSLMRVEGFLRMTGAEEYQSICQALQSVLAAPLLSRGHYVQFVFACDPEDSRAMLKKAMQPMHASCDRTGLNLHHVLDDWGEALASYCAAESMYLAVWTTPEILARAEQKKSMALAQGQGQNKGQGLLVHPGEAMSRTTAHARLRDAHRAVVREIAGALRGASCLVHVAGSHEAVRMIRSCNCPSWTAPDWRPVLPGDRLPLRAPEKGAAASDATSFVPPVLARQVWPLQARVYEGRFVEVDNRLYAPFVMSMPPQNVQPFSSLFAALAQDGLPFRCAVLIGGDGMRGQGLKSAAASILSFASSANVRLHRSYAALRELELAGEICVGLQAAFVTWVRLDACADLHEARERLSRRAARFAQAVQSWGSCDTCMLTGDPLWAYTATLPAASYVSPAVKAVCPLSEAVRLLPLYRPGSPWTEADVPLRTPDGRAMPLKLFAKNMASWNEICFAGMGSGKSFFLNTLNFFFLLRPGLSRLPWLTVIDIGQSCSGVIELVRAALPPSMRHLAVFARLRNTRSCAVNPFDTLLCCPYPTRAHASFLINFLSLLCTPLSETAPQDGITDILREALDAVYRRLAPDGEEPRRFDAHAEPEVAEWIRDNAPQLLHDASWWEVVRELFEAGETALAVLAQRHAVPLLADCMVEMSNPLLKNRFAAILVHGSGESVPEACARHLTTAIREYPLLAAPTQFSLGEARVVGLDLTEVTPRGGPAAERQSGIMYLLARFAGAAHFFNTMADLEQVPIYAREYHRQRFEDLVSLPKRLCYDEFHRASCADMNNPLSRQIIADLTCASREARKQNLAICLYSQQLSDFPKVLVDLATNVYAMGAGNAQEAEEIGSRFGLSRAAVYALRHSTKPTKAGADFVALQRTSEGECLQKLTCTAGSITRWAFSTTAEDMRVRNALYQAFGCAKALRILKKAYPEGTVRDELERRKYLRRDEGADEAEDLVQGITEELLQRGREEEA